MGSSGRGGPDMETVPYLPGPAGTAKGRPGAGHGRPVPSPRRPNRIRMARLSDLSLSERFWFHRYSFREARWTRRARLAVPLEEATVAVLTSAGLHRPEDPPFEKVKGGDPSMRWIPGHASPADLACTHPSSAWDRTGVLTDPNLALPLDRLRELQADGEIGSVAPRHGSIQGSITAPGRLVARTIPELVIGMADDGVHVVVLTPV